MAFTLRLAWRLVALLATIAIFFCIAAASEDSSSSSSNSASIQTSASIDSSSAGSATATPTVASGRCAPADAEATTSGPCNSGSVLSLTGTGFTSTTRVTIGRDAEQQGKIHCNDITVSNDGDTLRCTLNIDSTVADGQYPVTLDGDVSAGNVMTGTYLQQTVPGWDKTPLLGVQYLVATVSSSWPSTGSKWTIYGNFDASKTYKVLFYNVEEGAVAGNGDKTPTCDSPTVTSSSLTCTITVESSVMGMWGILVQDTSSGAFLPTPAALRGSIAVNPTLPTVTKATGDCAADSSKCVAGAVLTFEGKDFNQQKPEYNVITIGAASGSSFTCKATQATATALTCELGVNADAAAGSYGITAAVHVCTMGMVSPAASIGTFVYAAQEPGTAGWNAYNNGGHGTPSQTVWLPSSANKAAVAFAVVFAVSFAVCLVALIVVLVRVRKVWSELVWRRQAERELPLSPPREMLTTAGKASAGYESNAPDYFPARSAVTDGMVELHSLTPPDAHSGVGNVVPLQGYNARKE